MRGCHDGSRDNVRWFLSPPKPVLGCNCSGPEEVEGCFRFERVRFHQANVGRSLRDVREFFWPLEF